MNLPPKGAIKQFAIELGKFVTTSTTTIEFDFITTHTKRVLVMSVGSQRITISATAYHKLILHSCRYFSTQVGGILLASSSNLSQIVDAVPLFHGNPATTTFDLGFNLIEAFAKKQNLQIVGYYHGHELKQASDVTRMGTLPQRIGDRISESGSGSIVVLIDNNTPLNGESPSIKVRDSLSSPSFLFFSSSKLEATSLSLLLEIES